VRQCPIPHGEHYEPSTLRRSYKSAFLHPEEEIHVSKICHRDDKQNALKVVSPYKGQTDQITEESPHM
jgi:hypothetical protein